MARWQPMQLCSSCRALRGGDAQVIGVVLERERREWFQPLIDLAISLPSRSCGV